MNKVPGLSAPMRQHLFKIFIYITLISLPFIKNAPAQMYKPPRQELLVGFGVGHLQHQAHYRLIPVAWDINFDLKKFAESKGLHTPGLLDAVWEPMAAWVIAPHSNAELASNCLLKFGLLPLTFRWQPYLKGGLGAVYLTQHVHSQSTQFNFNEYAGLGFHYFFKPNLAMSVEYRYRHLSNASMRSPNGGINTQFALLGISLSF